MAFPSFFEQNVLKAVSRTRFGMTLMDLPFFSLSVPTRSHFGSHFGSHCFSILADLGLADQSASFQVSFWVTTKLLWLLSAMAPTCDLQCARRPDWRSFIGKVGPHLIAHIAPSANKNTCFFRWEIQNSRICRPKKRLRSVNGSAAKSFLLQSQDIFYCSVVCQQQAGESKRQICSDSDSTTWSRIGPDIALLAEKSRIKWHNKFKAEKPLDDFFGMKAWETKRFVEHMQRTTKQIQHMQRTTVCPKVSRALSPVAAEAKAIPPFCLLYRFALELRCDSS